MIYLTLFYCRRSSVVEQGFCKPLVGGSNPSAGSISVGRWRSGQSQQTVNLSAYAYGGSNPPLPTINQG